MCWRGFSEGRGCPSLLLLLGSGFMLLLLLSAGEVIYERRLIVEKLRVCVCVCASADVSEDLCVYSVCVFFSVWVRVKRQDWLATVLAADTGGWQGGKHAAIPRLLFSTSYSFYCLSQSRCVLSLYASLSLFIFLSLCFCFPLTTPLLRQQGAVLEGMTLKCGDCSYIMGACGWAMSACVYVLISVCTNSLCLFVCIYIKLPVCMRVWTNVMWFNNVVYISHV